MNEHVIVFLQGVRARATNQHERFLVDHWIALERNSQRMEIKRQKVVYMRKKPLHV